MIVTEYLSLPIQNKDLVADGVASKSYEVSLKIVKFYYEKSYYQKTLLNFLSRLLLKP